MVENIAAWLGGKPVRKLKDPVPGEKRATGFCVDAGTEVEQIRWLDQHVPAGDLAPDKTSHDPKKRTAYAPAVRWRRPHPLGKSQGGSARYLARSGARLERCRRGVLTLLCDILPHSPPGRRQRQHRAKNGESTT